MKFIKNLLKLFSSQKKKENEEAMKQREDARKKEELDLAVAKIKDQTGL